ncbi:amidohydrolase family protein [Saliphagus sp. GCM10025308]
MDDADVEAVMAHDLTMIGSDGNSMKPTGPLGDGVPHPRSYGTFPRVLGHYVRERGIISLETAVHKMTGQPAARLDLEDRGVLKEGVWADLTVFDPDTVAQGGSFVDPDVYPVGIQYVMVNGEFVVKGHPACDQLRSRAASEYCYRPVRRTLLEHHDRSAGQHSTNY